MSKEPIESLQHITPGFWFPGRWVGGISLLVAPIVIWLGVVLRIQFHFFFPDQLAAVRGHYDLMFASYSCFLLGNILLWPAIATVAKCIGDVKPGWATCGGSLVIFGLFARTFHGGVDHLAFQLVDQQGLQSTVNTMANVYGSFHVVSSFSISILMGWIILAIGGYLSGVMGIMRSIGLGMMSLLMIGVLKGTTWTSVMATTGLCFSLCPLGIKLLSCQPRPRSRDVVLYTAIVVVSLSIMFLLGQAG